MPGLVILILLIAAFLLFLGAAFRGFRASPEAPYGGLVPLGLAAWVLSEILQRAATAPPTP